MASPGRNRWLTVTAIVSLAGCQTGHAQCNSLMETSKSQCNSGDAVANAVFLQNPTLESCQAFCDVHGRGCCFFEDGFSCQFIPGPHTIVSEDGRDGQAVSCGSPYTLSPTLSPTTTSPTTSPHASPSVSPTQSPHTSPSLAPTTSPTTPSPTASPHASPSMAPTLSPTTTSPTASPHSSPSTAPTLSPTTTSPTVSPHTAPSVAPTTAPTTTSPTMSPHGSPSMAPTLSPTTTSPTATPTASPNVSPSVAPTLSPTTNTPSMAPTVTPTLSPTTTCSFFTQVFTVNEANSCHQSTPRAKVKAKPPKGCDAHSDINRRFLTLWESQIVFQTGVFDVHDILVDSEVDSVWISSTFMWNHTVKLVYRPESPLDAAVLINSGQNLLLLPTTNANYCGCESDISVIDFTTSVEVDTNLVTNKGTRCKNGYTASVIASKAVKLEATTSKKATPSALRLGLAAVAVVAVAAIGQTIVRQKRRAGYIVLDDSDYETIEI